MRRFDTTWARSLTLFALFLLLLSSAAPSAAQQTLGVYIANQGNFSDGNGSITFYNPITNERTPVLEDVATIYQSVEVFKGRVYAVANTGGRIDILNAETNERLPSISGLTNPRYIAFASETKAYVTNQDFEGKSFVSVVDLENGTVGDTLQVPGTPDHIVVVGTRAYVALGAFATSNLVGVIDVETDALIEVIDVGCIAPRFLVVDDEDEVHVVCSGTVDFSTGDETPGAIVTLNGATGEILGRIEATTLLGPSAGALGTGQDATYSSARQLAFVIAKENILVLDTSTNTLAETLEIGGDLINAVAYDDASGHLYLTRHDGTFTTAGRIERYPATPSPPILTFDVAIAPVHIAFYRDETATAVEQTSDAVPESFVLHPNYPNPFNPATTIPFDIAQATHVTLTIIDMLGREVATLVDGPVTPGRYETTWETDRMPSGVYLSRLEANGQVSTRRLVLLK